MEHHSYEDGIRRVEHELHLTQPFAIIHITSSCNVLAVSQSCQGEREAGQLLHLVRVREAMQGVVLHGER
jgi:uncharacterized membrane protein